ncbi:hypothetical protein RUM44_005155 [Polyplax serrata]|uniref:Uncharacterized protein n=1 Tax=Polyplax serrata TaxID=468196 RepID=A0ABR1AE82_POLSC
MEWKLLSALLILSIAGENRRSFVDTAPLKDGEEQLKFSNGSLLKLNSNAPPMDTVFIIPD